MTFEDVAGFFGGILEAKQKRNEGFSNEMGSLWRSLTAETLEVGFRKPGYGFPSVPSLTPITGKIHPPSFPSASSQLIETKRYVGLTPKFLS
jgi:hypothetical protein